MCDVLEHADLGFLGRLKTVTWPPPSLIAAGAGSAPAATRGRPGGAGPNILFRKR